MTLLSLITSFLKHALLNTYGETEGKHSKINICEDEYVLFVFQKEHQKAKHYQKNHIINIHIRS
jgi:hypothetical protein